jgi:hypothetical protein
MSAPNDQPGAIALEVAALGNEVMASFTKFITSGKIPNHSMENILGHISITTSVLTDLGTTINNHVNVCYISDDVIRPTCESCKTDLTKLLVLFKEASEKGMWEREGTLGGKPVTAEVDPWILIDFALSTTEPSHEFWSRVVATPYGLVALRDTVNYKIFKELNRRSVLHNHFGTHSY